MNPNAPNMPLVEAIARMEGWADPTARNRRNHNPGNIEDGHFARAHGATGTDGRFAIFATDEAGFAALRALLTGPAYHGLTVVQGLAKYAPSCENDTGNYVGCVCRWVGCQPGDSFPDLIQA